MKRLALIALIAVVTVGCAGDPSVPQPSPLPDLKTRLILGQEVWSSDTGEGAGDRVSGLTLAVDGRRVYAGNPDGVVTALELESGDTAWQRQTDYHLIAGPTTADGMLFFGTRDGLLVALSAKDGSKLWVANLDSEVLSAPAAGHGVVVAQTLDGRVVGREMASGAHRWTVEQQVPTLTLRGASSPLIDGENVYVGLANGKVLGLSLRTGEQLWMQQVAVPTGRSELERVVDVDAELMAADDELYAASIGNRLISISLDSGRVRWSREVGSRTGMAFDVNQIFVTDLDSRVKSFSRSSGAAKWSQDALSYRRLTAPVMYRGYVMVADYEGYLHWMIPEGGTLIGRYQAVGDPVRTAPVVVGDLILVLDTDGTVAAVKGVFPEREDE
ncbi:MAG: outer membrane protein assembly factor BamB [Salinisphaera sp.]|nr:outer membrane protein assembly factor BamB [Salinisphaera sp.]MDN5937168.1 outer membrane protein assembly factor BamB [Salinisphaera sp.]